MYNTKLTLDAAVGGALMDKPYEDAYQLIKNMAQNHYQWEGEQNFVEKRLIKGGMYEVNGIDHVNAKVDALTKKIESLNITPTATIDVATSNCELCGTPGHNSPQYHLLVGIPSYHVKYTQGNRYSNTYNLGWRNHPNFSYKNNNMLFAPNLAPDIPLGYKKGAPTAA